MKNLINYINEVFIDEELFKIDSEIICESLQCTVLREVAAQLMKYNKDQQAQIDKEKKESEAEGRHYWGRDKANSPKFSDVFVTKWSLPWDKITDKDVQVVDASTWDTQAWKNSADIRKVINTKKTALLIVQDPKTKKFDFMIHYGGSPVILSKDHYYDYNYKSLGESWTGLNQKSKIELCKGKTLYFIDLTGKADETYELQNKRSSAKEGMIKLDPASLARMAEKNRERYKKIVAKMKSMNINNDPLFDACNNIIKKVTNLAVEVAKDPVSNADKLDAVAHIMPYVCDTRRWEQTGKWTGMYKGVNGLLPMIVSYARNVKYAAAEGSEYGLGEVKKAKAEIEKALVKIDDLAKKYNITL